MRDALPGSSAREPIHDPNLEPPAPTTASEVKTPPKASKVADSAGVDTFEPSKKDSPDAQKTANPNANARTGLRERISQLWQSLLEALGIRSPATSSPAAKTLTGLDAVHAALDDVNVGDLEQDPEKLEAIKTALKGNPLLTDLDFLNFKKDPYGKGYEQQQRATALANYYKTPEGQALKKLVDQVKDGASDREKLVAQLGPLLDPGRNADTERGTELLDRLTNPRIRF